MVPTASAEETVRMTVVTKKVRTSIRLEPELLERLQVIASEMNIRRGALLGRLVEEAQDLERQNATRYVRMWVLRYYIAKFEEVQRQNVESDVFRDSIASVLFDECPDAALIVGADATILRANKSVAAALRTDAAMLVGVPFHCVFAGEIEKVLDLLKRQALGAAAVFFFKKDHHRRPPAWSPRDSTVKVVPYAGGQSSVVFLMEGVYPYARASTPLHRVA